MGSASGHREECTPCQFRGGRGRGRGQPRWWWAWRRTESESESESEQERSPAWRRQGDNASGRREPRRTWPWPRRLRCRRSLQPWRKRHGSALGSIESAYQVLFIRRLRITQDLFRDSITYSDHHGARRLRSLWAKEAASWNQTHHWQPGRLQDQPGREDTPRTRT